ncbi:ATP/maltotriose-dependent transcriptional regulator MalT [Actinoplanes tereljensis]|nr:LuxR C-terminal-related transcriptional regulator [Actinoplanes tereljensis]
MALHHALNSLASDGRHTTVTRLPDAADPRHLATVRVGADIPIEAGAVRHLRTTTLRHTDRRPELSTPVDADKLRSIAAAAGSEGAMLRLLRPRQVLDLASAAGRAQNAEAEETVWAGFLGFAAWATGDVSGALETFTQAVAGLHAAGNFVDELSATVVLSDLWLAAGRPDQARRLCAQALASAEAYGSPVRRAAAALHVALSEMDIEAEDLEGAASHLGAAAPDDRPMTESSHRWFVAKGLLAWARGDAEGAVQLLNQAEQLHRPGFFPDVRPIAALRARVWIEQGRLPEAADWARERGVAVTDDARYLREFDHLTLVRLLVAQHRARPDRDLIAHAAQLLDRLLEAAEASGRTGSVREIRRQQTLVREAQGLRPYAREPSARMAESLSGRELDVLRLLDSELTGPQIARELFVSHNTVRTHTKHVFTKLGVTNRRAAVLRAREYGLI